MLKKAYLGLILFFFLAVGVYKAFNLDVAWAKAALHIILAIIFLCYLPAIWGEVKSGVSSFPQATVSKKYNPILFWWTVLFKTIFCLVASAWILIAVVA